MREAGAAEKTRLRKASLPLQRVIGIKTLLQYFTLLWSWVGANLAVPQALYLVRSVVRVHTRFYWKFVCGAICGEVG